MIYGSIPGLSDRISRLVLGSVSFSTANQDLASSMLEHFVAHGGTAIDTAQQYGHGESERAIGAWLRVHDRRNDVFILTKGAHYHLDDAQNMIHRVTPEAITEDLLSSLDHLQIATADLYLLHRDDPSKPVGPIVECLNKHYQAGRIRAFGGSNWTPQRIEAANAYAKAHGLQPFVASSPNLALAIPSEPMWPNCLSVAGDAAAFTWYRERQFPLFAWSSQASGFFSGRFSPEDTSDANVVRVYYREDNWERLRRAREVARQHGCTPTQVALAWVLHQPLNVFALIGPRTLAELDDCLGALEVRLTPQEVGWLNLEG